MKQIQEHELTFSELRRANLARLPQFKNRHGELAHTKPDGSDWSVAQWVQAWVGEVGEFCEVREAYERGNIDWESYREKASKELPDSVIYQDILAARALDATVQKLPLDAAQLLMVAIARIGKYANARKKFERGDIAIVELRETRFVALREAIDALQALCAELQGPNAPTHFVDSNGIDLGAATVAKFNEVSQRVGCELRLGT